MNKSMKFLSVGIMALGIAFIATPSVSEAFTVSFGNLGTYGTGYAANTGANVGYSAYRTADYGSNPAYGGVGYSTGPSYNYGIGYGMGNNYGYGNGVGYSTGYNYATTGGPSPMYNYSNPASFNAGYGYGSNIGYGYGSNINYGYGSNYAMNQYDYGYGYGSTGGYSRPRVW